MAERCRRGVGTVATAQFAAAWLAAVPDASQVCGVPDEGHVASCRALARAGFHRVRTVTVPGGADDVETCAVYVLDR